MLGSRYCTCIGNEYASVWKLPVTPKRALPLYRNVEHSTTSVWLFRTSVIVNRAPAGFEAATALSSPGSCNDRPFTFIILSPRSKQRAAGECGSVLKTRKLDETFTGKPAARSATIWAFVWLSRIAS